MKMLLGMFVLAFSLTAFAAETEATKYQKTAQDTIVNLYGRADDTVSTDLVEAGTSPEGVKYEVWNVTLSNGPSVGSIAFEVLVAERTELAEGQPAAVVSVKFLVSN